MELREQLMQAMREGNPVMACLLLSAQRHPNLSPGRYQSHIERLGEDTGRYFEARGEDTPEAQLSALQSALETAHGYRAVQSHRDILETADLVRAIDRREACPLALALLCLAAARAQGWGADILDFGGAYVFRLTHEARRFICDPSGGWKELQAHDLRRLVKAQFGPAAELSATYYEPVADADLPVALENLLKIKLIEDSEYDLAYRIVERLRLIRPDEYRLLLDAGVLAARTGRYTESAAALERYIETAPREHDRREAAELLRDVRGHL
jgi:regulator of sirC expression with transglutaminase-like and TPR domain